jgi:hypothetical protein
MNSRAKGKAGELELAAWLREQGVPARRGWAEGHDITTSISGIHIECKRTERSYPYEWLAQADKDAKMNQIPVVLHRQNRRDWIAILDAGDLLALLKRAGLWA